MDTQSTGKAPTKTTPATPKPAKQTRAGSATRKPAKSKAAAKTNGRKTGLDWRSLSTPGALAVGAATLAGAAFFAWERWKSDRADDEGGYSPAAFADVESHRENFDQTRAAGPAAMRDRPDDWDNVDQAADESFPASDPPSTY